MSVISTDGEKTELPRAQTFDLTEAERLYAELSPQNAKQLAAWHLATLCGWPHELIARAFGCVPRTSRRHAESAAAALEAHLKQEAAA